MATIHISEADAAKDFAGLMEHVRGGDQIIIDAGGQEVVIQAKPKVATLKDLAALLERHRDTLDEDFARDLTEARKSLNQPLDTSVWD